MGPTGPQGFQGNTGPKGDTGNGLFDETYGTGTNVSNTINYDSIGNVVGLGRKFPVLMDDGSLTFDYIKTTDIFNIFTISSFTINGDAEVLIAPSGNYSLTGRTFNTSYTPPISTITSASITVNTTNVGYPLNLTSPFTSIAATGSIAYPASKNTTITFTITATASDGTNDTATDTIVFRQNNYYGTSSEISLGPTGLTSLTNVLSSSRARTFSANAGSGQYVYYAYPTSYGNATFTVGGFAGGFSQIQQSGGITHTNSNGYDEKYYIYRSDNANLGSITVVVS